MRLFCNYGDCHYCQPFASNGLNPLLPEFNLPLRQKYPHGGVARNTLSIQNVRVPQNKPRRMSKDEQKLVGTIAANVKELRLSRGLTQLEMTSFGFNYRQYQRLESGKYSPTLGTLLRISKVFKVKVIDLLS